jgi:Spy/CpxP family protein refolding chaperone
MRTSHAIALVALSLVSTAQLAQAQTAAPRARQEQQRAEGRRMDGRGGRGGLFRDITLSATEQSKLKEIRAKYGAEARTLRESLRPAMEEVRAARQKGDTVAARAAWDRTQRGRESIRALMERERAEIRSALSAENQRKFDANLQQLQQRRADGRRNGKDGSGRGELRARRGGRIG